MTGNSGKSPASHRLATVIHNYEPKFPDELRLRKGDLIQIYSSDSQLSGDDGWYYGKIFKVADSSRPPGNLIGLFPHNFVTENPKIPSIAMSELKLGHLLGTGASGKVYKGSYQGISVALKEARGITGKDSFEEFLLEAHTIHTLKHENITSLYGLGVKPDKTLCLVLEYADGGSLQNVLRQYGLSAGVIVNWAKQIASGMEYIHKRDLIHRDLKSGNVLLAQRITPDCDMTKLTLKISDFGTARTMEKTVELSRIVGTVRWLAPEVIRESQTSKASDVWSYGVVVWEMLTGEIPFSHLTELAAIQYKLATGALTLHIPETTPEPIKILLSQILQYDRKLRPSASDLIKELVSIESSEFVHLNDQDLNTMRIEWQEELAHVAQELMEKEHRLAIREKELENNARTFQEEKESFELQKEEMYNMMLRLAMQHFSKKNTGTPKPMSRKLNRKMHSVDISEPENFQHLFHYPNRPEENDKLAMMKLIQDSMGAPSPLQTYNRDRSVTTVSAHQPSPLQQSQSQKEEQTRRHNSDKNMFARRKKPSLDSTATPTSSKSGREGGKKKTDEGGTPEPDTTSNTLLEFLDFSKLTRRCSGPQKQLSQFYYEASEIPNLELPAPESSIPRKTHRRTRSWGLQSDHNTTSPPLPVIDPLSLATTTSPKSSLFNKLPSFGKGKKKKKKGHNRSKSWGMDDETPFEASITSSESSAVTTPNSITVTTPSVNVIAASPSPNKEIR